ncbi:WD repeat-containing protein 73 isoform X1 [Tachysurus fulvidraco]|uniref:WD repeat-containing protein 73 isoform X1 n=1 Tax=Tachysurus fulvidraco TaxID=1234273 RepID=UPI000F4EE765|nr:WD repeat-containing protein 73 isoform X1 [Tachysurus fulvidraco]
MSSDEEEEWFMQSLTLYKDLHVFQLEHPTKTIEWTGEKSVCVAGYSSEKNEILELLLPLKLYAKKNQGLCPERDFKVQHGGFSDEPIECLRHIFGKRCVVTSGQHSSKLQVWDIGDDDNDVMRRTGVINCSHTSTTGRKLASGFTEDASVLHGSTVHDVQHTDVASGRMLYAVETDSLDVVNCLQFVNTSTFVICATNGTLYMGDLRDQKVSCYALSENTTGSEWAFGLRTAEPQCDPASCIVARLSSSGQVIVSDLRNPSTLVGQAQLNLQQNHLSNEFLTVTWAPALDNHLAVSGFDGTVQIFDTRRWSIESQTPQPIFVHRGHNFSCEENSDTSLLVTTHVWHPQRPRTLLSAASDGSIHVWDWVDNESLIK